MTDSELRGIVLRCLYDQRKDRRLVQFKPDDFPGVEPSEVSRIVLQLRDMGLVNWKPTLGGGCGNISAPGVDVIEGNLKPPLSVTVNQTFTANNSPGAQVGTGNVQQTFIDIDRLVAAINNSKVAESEKVEAKSRLKQFLEHPVVAAIVGGLAGRVP